MTEERDNEQRSPEATDEDVAEAISQFEADLSPSEDIVVA